MHSFSPSRLRRGALIVLLIINIIATGAACKRAPESNANSATPSQASTNDVRATPPFPTKEPERYQALMVTSGNLGASVPQLNALTNQQMLVARDGAKRRLDSEMMLGVKITYLQLPSGRYILYPAKKLYAEINTGAGDGAGAQSQVPSDFAPDKLVKGAHAGARYEKLGTEEVNGRMTTKYRVTDGGATGAETQSTETIVWADESLGMPVKFETTSKDGAKYSMELRDIRQEVDPALFELPKDYERVEHRVLISRMMPSLP